jgi:hypothetical protein
VEQWPDYVSVVGFPIAAFFLMWKYITGEFRATKQAMQDNTLAVRELTSILKAKKKYIKSG